MNVNKIYEGDCFDLIKKLDENSIDLIVTSPPYSDVKSYGKKINVFHPDNYADWFLPLFFDMYSVIKDTGSIIINIDDRCYKKLRHPYVFDLILKVIEKTNLKLYDYYFWLKPTAMPMCGPKRVNHYTEWLLHFVKDENKVKWNMDDVRVPYKESSISRANYTVNNYITDENGIKKKDDKWKHALNPKGAIPTNVLSFNIGSSVKGNDHPAPFLPELPSWFIKALTDKNDIVLDPFIGSGTTAIASIELERQWIGFELNPAYIEMAESNIQVAKTKQKNKNQYKIFF